MNDERLARLEAENQQRAVDHARLSSSVEHLSEAVQMLSTTVQEFRDTMNKGRGAMWIVLAVCTLLGGLVSTAINKWLAS